MVELRDVLKDCAERLDRHRRPNQRIGEQNTKNVLIEPVLQALGWDTRDPEEVNREYRRRGSDNPVDYALLLLRTPRLFVEAKGLGENIDDPRWANQTISYPAVAGVEWVALTDGAQWRIYNAHAPVPIEDKLFRSVDIAQDPDEAVELLGLLSKDNMRENRIQELWQSYFVDRQIHGVLTGLFTGTEPPNDLVTLIAKRTERLSKDDVRASLTRARASFDFPLPALTAPAPVPIAARPTARPRPAQAATRPDTPDPSFSGAPPDAASVPTPASGGSPRGRRSVVTSQERATKLVDLLRSGRIHAGELTAHYDGQVWTARLGEDGSLNFQGQQFTSLSAVGEAVKRASRGPDLPDTVAATDGWEFWQTRDEVVGESSKLKEIRKRSAAAQR